MAVTNQEIQAWFAQNPNATAEQVYQGMIQYGVSPQQLSEAINVPLPQVLNAYNQQAANRQARLQGVVNSAVPNQATDEQIRAYMELNPGVTAQRVYQDMVRYGVSPQRFSQATGIPLDQVSQEYTAQRRPGLQSIVDSARPGNVTEDQIRAYMELNPGVTAERVYQDMVRYGVSPQLFSQATGIPLPRVAQEYAAQQAAVTPTGLVGFEQATTQGVGQASDTLREAQEQAQGQLQTGYEDVARMYNLNIDDLRQASQQAQSQIGQSMDVTRGLVGQNITGLEQAGQLARGDIERTFGQAGELFTPYQQAGTTALQRQLALSGALGSDAFNQAYQESPYVRFLREQGERSTLAGAAATGGLGGGRVQQELVRFGQDLASKGLQQQIENLSNLTGVGYNAAAAGGNILTGMGSNLANIGMGLAGEVANQRTNLANLEQQYGTNIANLLTGTARDVTGQRSNVAQERSGLGTNLANLTTSTGTNIANLQAQAAQNIANQRAQAGELLASQIGNASVGLGNLAESQGLNLSDLLSQYGSSGLNLSQGYTADQIAAIQAAANQEAMSQEDLAARRASLLAGQQYNAAPQTDYTRIVNNALNAAAMGYDLGGMMTGGQRNYTPSFGPFPNSLGGYRTSPAQLGTVSTGIPGQPSFNVFNPTTFQAFRLAGRI